MKKTAALLLAFSLLSALLFTSCTIEIHSSFDEKTSSSHWSEESSFETHSEAVSAWTETDFALLDEDTQNRIRYLIYQFYGAFGMLPFDSPEELPREAALNVYVVMNSSIEGPEPGRKEVKAADLSAFLARDYAFSGDLVFSDADSERDGWHFDEADGVYRHDNYQPASLSGSTELVTEKVTVSGDRMHVTVKIASLEAGGEKQMEFALLSDGGVWKLSSAKLLGA